MTEFTLIRRNLFEKRGRTFLLCFSTVIAFLIFGLLSGFLNLTSAFEDPSSQSRLMVMNRTGILRPVPVSHIEGIRKIAGVEKAASVNLFGGYIADRQDSVPLLMVKPEDYLAVNRLEGLAEADRAAFVGMREAIIVDAATAAQRGWSPGDQVTIRSLFHTNVAGGNDWQFTVRGIFAAEGEQGPQSAVLGHFDYLNENLSRNRDLVNWITIVTTSPDVAAGVAERVDQLFSNSAYETKTQSEVAMAQAFLGQMGDLNRIVQLVVGAAFLALLFAIGNTTALAIRQRSRQIGVMKALGFTPGRIMRLTLAETMLLATLGAGLGLGLAALLLSLVLSEMRMPVPQFGLPTTTLFQGLALTLLLGVSTGILPSIGAMRVSPAKAFGRE